MKVEFSRTGGVAGVRLRATLDTDELPPEEADRLRHLLATASFFDQPSSLTSSTSQADRFHYQVTVKEGDRIKTVEMDESCVPRTLLPLIEYLIEFARTGRKPRGS